MAVILLSPAMLLYGPQCSHVVFAGVAGNFVISQNQHDIENLNTRFWKKRYLIIYIQMVRSCEYILLLRSCSGGEVDFRCGSVT